MISRLKLAAFTLAAAAIAAPSAYGVTNDGTLLSKASRQVVVVKRNSAAADPLAISMLRARGWTAGRIYDWTQGACSYQVKPSSCYLTPAQARLASQRLAQSMGGPRPTSAEAITPSIAQAKAVDPLAISMLRARGWTAGRIYDWTQGACSYEVKPASCYLTPAQARLASQSLAQNMGGPRPTSISAIEVNRPTGFDWGDALIGGVVTAGIFLVGAGGALLLHRRRELTHP